MAPSLSNWSPVPGASGGINPETPQVTTSLTVNLATTVALTRYNVSGTGIGHRLTFQQNGARTIDDVALATGQLILVKDQPSMTRDDNGIYSVIAPGDVSNPTVLERATIFDQAVDGEIQNGVRIVVASGTVNGGRTFLHTTQGTIVVDTTDLLFSPASFSDGIIPKSLGGNWTPSAFRETADRLIATKTVISQNASIQFGPAIKVGLAGDSLKIDNLSNNVPATVPDADYNQTTGTPLTSQTLQYMRIFERINNSGLPIQPVFSQQSNNNVNVIRTNNVAGSWKLLLTLNLDFDILVERYRFRFAQQADNCRFTVRANSSTGTIWYQSHLNAELANGNGFSFIGDGTIETMNLPGELVLKRANTYHFALESFTSDADGNLMLTNQVNILGEFNTTLNEFVPYYERDWHDIETVGAVTNDFPYITAFPEKLLTGTVAITANNADVVGTGTLFTTELQLGRAVQIGRFNRTVIEITDNTHLKLGATIPQAYTAQPIYTNDELLRIEDAAGVRYIEVKPDGVAKFDAGLETSDKIRFNGISELTSFRNRWQIKSLHNSETLIVAGANIGGRPSFLRLDAATDNSIWPLQATTQTASSIPIFLKFTQDRYVTGVTVKTPAASGTQSGIRVVARKDNASGQVIFKSHGDAVWSTGGGYIVPAGTFQANFNLPWMSVAGETVHITIEKASGTFQMLGDPVPTVAQAAGNPTLTFLRAAALAIGMTEGQFFPFMTSAGRNATTVEMVAKDNPVFKQTPEVALTGTVGTTNGSTAIVGTGTLFTTQLVVGQTVRLLHRDLTTATRHELITRVTAITDNLNLTVATAPTFTFTGVGIFEESALIDVQDALGVSALNVDVLGKTIVEKTVQIKGGVPAIGKVLTGTDALGNSTWSDPASAPVDLQNITETIAGIESRLDVVESADELDESSEDAIYTAIASVISRLDALRTDDLRAVYTSLSSLVARLESLRIPDIGQLYAAVGALSAKIESIEIEKTGPLFSAVASVASHNERQDDRLNQAEEDRSAITETIAGVEARVRALELTGDLDESSEDAIYAAIASLASQVALVGQSVNAADLAALASIVARIDALNIPSLDPIYVALASVHSKIEDLSIPFIQPGQAATAAIRSEQDVQANDISLGRADRIALAETIAGVEARLDEIEDSDEAGEGALAAAIASLRSQVDALSLPETDGIVAAVAALEARIAALRIPTDTGLVAGVASIRSEQDEHDNALALALEDRQSITETIAGIEAGKVNKSGDTMGDAGALLPSALLQLNSTTKGFLVPRMTQAQRTAISAPAEGLEVWQTDGLKGKYQFNGSAWEQQ